MVYNRTAGTSLFVPYSIFFPSFPGPSPLPALQPWLTLSLSHTTKWDHWGEWQFKPVVLCYANTIYVTTVTTWLNRRYPKTVGFTLRATLWMWPLFPFWLQRTKQVRSREVSEIPSSPSALQSPPPAAGHASKERWLQLRVKLWGAQFVPWGLRSSHGLIRGIWEGIMEKLGQFLLLKQHL